MDRLVEQMDLRGLSKDQVSRMCRGLDEQVELFRARPLEGEYPYLWLDAKVEKVRERGGVRQKALVIAYAVHESGVREVLGIDVGRGRDRGVLDRVPVLVEGPRPSGRAVVRLRRATGTRQRDRSGARLPVAAVHRYADTGDEARERLAEVVDRLKAPAPKVAGLLEQAEEELLAFYSFPREHWPKLRSTNPLERFNKEIGRRSDVVGIYPNDRR